jgi:hypothetical protein
MSAFDRRSVSINGSSLDAQWRLSSGAIADDCWRAKMICLETGSPHSSTPPCWRLWRWPSGPNGRRSMTCCTSMRGWMSKTGSWRPRNKPTSWMSNLPARWLARLMTVRDTPPCPSARGNMTHSLGRLDVRPRPTSGVLSSLPARPASRSYARSSTFMVLHRPGPRTDPPVLMGPPWELAIKWR